MFLINDQIIVDHMGFPANASQLKEIAVALEKSQQLEPTERIFMAKRHAQDQFPGMVEQIDFTTYA